MNAKTPHSRPKLTAAPANNNRSRVTNGRDVLPGVDQRSAIARRYRDLISAISIDQGGADDMAEVRKQLIRRFASGSVLAEQLEARLVAGDAIDISELATLSSMLVRLVKRIGINRRSKNITPILRDYLDQADSAAEEDRGESGEAGESARS